MSMIRFVLFTRSNTQRVVAEIHEDSVLITKEWRRTDQDDWLMGKGITIPSHHLINLGNILKCQDKQKLDNMLSHYEKLQEGKYGNNGEKTNHSENTHRWD